MYNRGPPSVVWENKRESPCDEANLLDQDEFRGKLDEALVLAISSDHDLHNEESLRIVHANLSSLAAAVEAEEATGFVADGLGTAQKDPVDDLNDIKSSHETSQTRDNSGAHESLLSSGTSYSDGTGEGSVVARIDAFDDATDETKNKLLASMFPSLNQDQVNATLKEMKGDFQNALDHLLTLQFLQSTEVRARAIDAFFKPEDEENYQAGTNKGKKKRKKGGKQASSSEVDKEDESEATCESNSLVFEVRPERLTPAAVNNILFISERLDLPFDGVAQAYHKSGKSQGKTLAAVLGPFIDQGVEAQGDTASARVKQLSRRYKKVPAKYLSAIVQIADTIPQWTDDIAALLEKHFTEISTGPLAVSYSLTPIEDEVEDGFTIVPGKKSGVDKENARNVPGLSYSSAALNGVSSASLRSHAAELEQARLNASASAASVIRRGRSNHLYKQAAVVYTERARESAQRATAANSQAAQALVAERRTADTIDLHGLTVSDGVTIALGAVREWYDELGEYRAREAKRGFTVITGIGKHSSGGVSRMRQGVCSALVKAGWKVEVGTGKFVVTGRR